MEQSILISTKKILGLDESYTAFDLDVITHINAAFAVIFQLGVLGEPVVLEDDTVVWSDVNASTAIVSLMKTYIWLWVRLNFDPPNTSYATQAAQEQLKEYEWRLYILRDSELIDEAEEVST